MRGQRIFSITSRIVFVGFYIVVIICVPYISLRTYRLVKGQTVLQTPPDLRGLEFHVQTFGPPESYPPRTYNYSEGKLAALYHEPDHFSFLVPLRSPIGYYDYFLSMLEVAAVLYGVWLLRAIFRSISVEEPFSDANARRIRNIGLLLIGWDVIKLINYEIFNEMAGKYFTGTTLLADIGGGTLVGLLLLTLSVVYRRGVEINSENQMTI